MTGKRKRPRTCIACRCESPKKAMLRVVRTPTGEIIIDPMGKKEGRGAYLCIDIECIELARKKDCLSRALKVRVDPGIYEEILVLLKKNNDRFHKNIT